MTPSPFDRRLVDLRLLGTPAQAEELAFLEDWAKWKAEAGPKIYQQKREAERLRHFQNTNRILAYRQKA